jgi:hypothetical protein
MIGCTAAGPEEVTMDPYFFDPIFSDGVFTEERIESAGVRVRQLVDRGAETEARNAVRLLSDMLLLAIADGRTADPQACASHYLTISKVVLGRETLLDGVQRRMKGASGAKDGNDRNT